MGNKGDFGWIFYFHTLLQLLELLSFLLIDWQILLVLLLLLQIQYSTLGGCVLTHAEFGKDKNYSFTWYYLVKIFPNLEPKKTTFIIRVIIPILLLILSIYLQVFVGYSPVLNLIR